LLHLKKISGDFDSQYWLTFYFGYIKPFKSEKEDINFYPPEGDTDNSDVQMAPNSSQRLERPKTAVEGYIEVPIGHTLLL